MDNQVKPITVAIMDKEYVVGCAEDEREALFASVEFLNRKLREQRDGGKVIGSERVAVMAALNIAHEYLDYRRHNDTNASEFGASIERIQSKIQSALARGVSFQLTGASSN
ncbi:MAG: cell division protein ZapA [Gammaproteobacteria bacterium]|nr:cell division protein ZapA [Gammaproteobacteria bacterium]